MSRLLSTSAALLLTLTTSCSSKVDPCTTTDDCPEGNTCLLADHVCVESCWASEECASGTCFWTSEFNYDDGWDGPGICKDDCEDSSLVCASSEVCSEHHDVCIPTCKRDRDCGDTLFCDEGSCVECLSDADCEGSEECQYDGSCDIPCSFTCYCNCSCSTIEISANYCMDCDSECTDACAESCG